MRELTVFPIAGFGRGRERERGGTLHFLPLPPHMES